LEVERTMADKLGVKHALATSSGTSAITLALMAAGAGPGDTVICPAYTWIATAHAAHILGCKIRVIDIEPSKPIMDTSQLEATSGARAFVVPVHMNGHAVGIENLRDKGYIVVEDAAQALGSKLDGALLGTSGHLGCFSFSVSKIIGSGQGGLLVTDSDELFAVASAARTHGLTDIFAPKYWHSAGHNFRFTDVMASILMTQIPKLAEHIEHVRSIAKYYQEALNGLENLTVVEHSTDEEFGPYVEARVPERLRNELVQFLETKGIGARMAFPPIPSAKYLRLDPMLDTPNAEAWSKEVLYLPSGPGLSLDQAEYVALVVSEMVSSWRAL